MAQINVLGILDEQGVIRAILNPDGSYSLQLANGDILQSVSPVFAWPGISIPGILTLPAANTFENGANVRLHPSNFIGAGVNPLGVEIQADALNNIWRPRGRQIIWSGFLGILGESTVFVTNTGRFNIGADPVLPSGLLNYAGAKLRCSEQYQIANLASGGSGPTIATYLGTNLVTYSSNPTVMDNTANASNNATFQPETLIQRDVITATKLLTNRHGIRGGTGSSGWLQNVTSGIDFAAAQMISFGVTNLGTATRIDMHGYEIAWEY